MMDQCRISLSMLVTSDKLEWTKYQCPFCKWILRDAVQTCCGHWLCQECAQRVLARPESRCPKDECAELLTKEDGNAFFPDRFVRKEVSQLGVRCSNHEKGCSWTGLSKELQHHLTLCEHNKVQCKHCADWISPSVQNAHNESCHLVPVACPFANFGCKQTEEITRDKVSEHLTGSTGLLQHLNIIANLFKEFTKSRSDSDDRAPGGESMVLKCGMEEIELLKSKIEKQDDLIVKLLAQVRKLDEAQQSKTADNDDLDFRLSAIENSNFDGTMVWRVPSFSQRMDDVRAEKYTSIFSLPFYSGRHGYKMCLRLYILGDGIGKATHMSLFIVIMKGEFDNILQWPFTYRVSFKLINQSGGKDVKDQFLPNPLSSCFQKPTKYMNTASGCPRFVTLQKLMSDGFVKDDIIFIKVKVDTASITHP